MGITVSNRITTRAVTVALAVALAAAAAVPAAAGTAAAAASATASATVTARVVMRLLTVIPIGGGNGTGSHLASAANDTVKYSAKIFPIVTRETRFPTFLSCHGDPGRIQ